MAARSAPMQSAGAQTSAVGPAPYRASDSASSRGVEISRQGGAKRLTLGGQLNAPAGPAPDRGPTVPHQHPRHRPNCSISRHQPANRFSARRDGISIATSQREYPQITVNTGNCAGLRVCPNPTASSIGGNDKSHCATSPPHTRCATPGPAADTPGATRPPGSRAPESTSSSRSARRSP